MLCTHSLVYCIYIMHIQYTKESACYSYKTLIGVHEMHGRMHPNQGLVTVLLVHDPLSSLAYPMITHTPLVASNLPIKTLVAIAMTNKFIYSIPRNVYIACHMHLHVDVFINRKIILDRHYGKRNNLSTMTIHSTNMGDTKHYQFFVLVYM